MRINSLGIALATFCVSLPFTALAQSRAPKPERFYTCTQYAGYGPHAIVVGPFEAPALANEDWLKMIDEVRQLVSQTFNQGYDNTMCADYATMAEALEKQRGLEDKQKYLREPYNWRYFPEWTPSFFKPTFQQSAIRNIALDFEPGDGSGFLHARRGYKRASIKLNYRFLLCANEIQVAYALDRKSLVHSQDYVDKFVGGNPNTIAPPSEPPVPMTVPLTLKVYLKKAGSPYVATLRDGTAGEALGMGCFTGQTSKIGLVAKLIGPKATYPEIKSYLDLLDLSGMTTAAEIDTPLLNPTVPPPPAAPRLPVRRKAK